MIKFRIKNLGNPPYLEVALDIPDWEKVEGIVKALPLSDAIIMEAGTPLIKRYGVEVVRKIHGLRPEAVVYADLKTLDTGDLEARLAGDATADIAGFSGLAPLKTQEKFIEECRKIGILSAMDTLNVSDPKAILEKLRVKPDLIEIHRAIDVEQAESHRWESINEIRGICGGRILIAVAGGIKIEDVDEALKAGADILVVGRAITQAKDIAREAEAFLRKLGKI